MGGIFPRKSYPHSGVECVQKGKEKKRETTRGAYGTNECEIV